MPRIWLEYLQHMVESGRLTDTRHAFDAALRSLPVTQHSRIWPLYLEVCVERLALILFVSSQYLFKLVCSFQ